jgi:hypothetical protein
MDSAGEQILLVNAKIHETVYKVLPCALLTANSNNFFTGYQLLNPSNFYSRPQYQNSLQSS